MPEETKNDAGLQPYLGPIVGLLVLLFSYDSIAERYYFLFTLKMSMVKFNITTQAD